MTTVFVHGFWGGPADWAPTLARLPLSARTWCPDLYGDEGLGPDVEPLAWADRFVHRVRADVGGRVRLVAYSMGGRLALHALLRVPGLFDRALILSSAALPALEDNRAALPALADDRAAWETRWARRFRADPWDALERDWSSEPVFVGSTSGPRRRDEDLRDALARSLEIWSPRRHAFGPADLKRTTARIDWAFGAGDQKYLDQAKQLRALPVGGQITIVPNAGHRLPFDAPDFVARWVSEGDHDD